MSDTGATLATSAAMDARGKEEEVVSENHVKGDTQDKTGADAQTKQVAPLDDVIKNALLDKISNLQESKNEDEKALGTCKKCFPFTNCDPAHLLGTFINNAASGSPCHALRVCRFFRCVD